MSVEKRPRPKILLGETVKVTTGCGNLYITMNTDEVGLFEVFATLGRAGGCAYAQNEGLTRLLTLGLRCGIPLSEIIHSLEGIRCPKSYMWPEEDRVLSCPDAIAKTLEQEVKHELRSPDD